MSVEEKPLVQTFELLCVLCVAFNSKLNIIKTINSPNKIIMEKKSTLWHIPYLGPSVHSTFQSYYKRWYEFWHANTLFRAGSKRIIRSLHSCFLWRIKVKAVPTSSMHAYYAYILVLIFFLEEFKLFYHLTPYMFHQNHKIRLICTSNVYKNDH